MNFAAVTVSIKNLCFLLASLAIFLGTLPAHAIVSMEDVHLGKPVAGFSGFFDLDLSNESGNTDQKGAASGVKLQWSKDRITDFILINYEYGETDGLKNKNKGFAHFRHINQFKPKFAWEGFSQFSSNEFTNLTLRALLGGGARLTLSEIDDRHTFLLGLGLFYEYEKIKTIYPEEKQSESVIRANTYLVFKFHFNDHVSLVSSTYYQPSLKQFADFRVVEDLSLVSSLTDNTALKVGIDIAHDSEPPRDIKRTDTSLKIGISISF